MRPKYIDREPPAGNDPDIWAKIIDYLAYLKERVNFAINNLSKTVTTGEASFAPGAGTSSAGAYRYTVSIPVKCEAMIGSVYVNGVGYPAVFTPDGLTTRCEFSCPAASVSSCRVAYVAINKEG